MNQDYDFEVEETEVEPRGCGGKRDTGGLYMTGRLGPGGAPMSTFFVDPFSFEARTALTPEQVNLLVGDSSVGVKLFQKQDEDGNIVEVIVLDVIGKSNYTPASFLEELRWLGPSRKISTSVGKQIAEYQRQGVPFTWQYVFKEVLPDIDDWIAINTSANRCPNNRHDKDDQLEFADSRLCSAWLYEMELPAAEWNEERQSFIKTIPAGYSYTVWQAGEEYFTPNAAVVCILPGNFLRMESVVGDGEPNAEHAELFGDLPNFKFVTE